MKAHKDYLFIGSHPDDIEIGCGGTVAKLTKAGHKCTFIIATLGEQGSLKYSLEELASLRQKEALKAATSLGVKDVYFLELADGLTHFELDEKIKLIKIIRKTKPHVVFTHSSCDHHPDHRFIHQLSIAAINSSGGPWFSEGGKAPHQVKEIYGYEVWNAINKPELLIDISKTHQMKLKALESHKSQIEDFPYMEAVTGLNQYRGALNGTKFSEAFEVIKTQL